jgi:hypothetical protein
MGVPGPVCVTKSLSSFFNMHVSPEVPLHGGLKYSIFLCEISADEIVPYIGTMFFH